MNKLLPILLSALFCFSLAAQTPVFRPQSSKELGGAKLTVLLQDSRGWLWCGAEKGLFRFNGLSFQSIGLADTFASAAVTALFESQGQIWAGFSNGTIGRVPIAGNFPPALTGDVEAEKSTRPTFLFGRSKKDFPAKRSRVLRKTNQVAAGLALTGKDCMSGKTTGCTNTTPLTMVWRAMIYTPYPATTRVGSGQLPMQGSASAACLKRAKN